MSNIHEMLKQLKAKDLLNRKVVIIGVAVIIFFILTYSFTMKFAKGTQQPNGDMPISTAEVIEREVIEWDEFAGKLEAVERVVIRPRVAGTIESIHFEEGQMVRKGELLFTIDEQPYMVEVSSAEAALALAKSQATFTNIDFERSSKLFASKAISQRDYDSSKNAKDSANANLQQAEAALKQAKLNLEYTNIIAPISGRVSRAEITTGNLVDSGGNAPILTTIVSLDPIYASFDVDEQTFVKYMQEGENKMKQIQVQIIPPGKNAMQYQGTVKSFDNELNALSGTARVRAVFNNTNGTLVPGLFVHIRIGSVGEDKKNLITERAVGTDQNKKFVFVVGNDNLVAYREIILGPVVDGGLRVVRNGLDAGEKIVVNGLRRVRPGIKVLPQMVAMDQSSITPVNHNDTKKAEKSPLTISKK